MSSGRGRLEQALTRAWLRRGALAWLLWPLALLMALIVGLRRRLYMQGWVRRERLPVPVIVVGNRIVGGAGKTPTTLAVLAHLRAQGWHPGVLTRGHGASPSDAPRLLDEAHAATLSADLTGDEPMLIWRRSRVPVMIHRDRARAGQALLAAHPEVDVLVCDDGLQHLRLARDIEIVVFDERGAGNGWLLPAGPLREPVSAPASALDGRPALVLYNADHPSTAQRGHLAARSLAPLQSLASWQTGAPAQPASAPPKQATLHALAGIAQPERFFEALRRQGWAVQGQPLPDHARWDDLPWPPGATHVVVTEKDAVKIDPARVQRERPHTTVWVAALHFEPEAAFWMALDARLPARPATT